MDTIGVIVLTFFIIFWFLPDSIGTQAGKVYNAFKEEIKDNNK